jgi:hypothetical protein
MATRTVKTETRCTRLDAQIQQSAGYGSEARDGGCELNWPQPGRSTSDTPPHGPVGQKFHSQAPVCASIAIRYVVTRRASGVGQV